jgi:adenylate cyclase
MPGPEIHANAYRTVALGFPLEDSPAWLDVLLIIGLAAIAPLLSIRLRLWGVALAVAGGIIYSVATQVAFNSGWIISFTYPIAAIMLTSAGALAVHYVTEAFERERVRGLFSRFVPESVVGEVLAQADGARLGGVGRHATVMFSDLRGFTSSAEDMPAESVIEVLNHYLGEMSDAILAHGGTLVSYMGDGIMAVFGAPIELPGHADHAFAAACEMLEKRLPKFNAWMREHGLGDGYRMGIGLNTGPVMSGNVGHERRLEYTAVGDTTNTSSRIEGMTKGTPYSLFIAESTYELLTEVPPSVAFVDEVEIRGRQAKLKLWGFEPVPQPAEAPVHEPVEAAAGLEPA